MSSPCEPHSQVLAPCADDAVSALLGLGTRGDVAFSEYGYLALTAGQTDAAIEFLYEKTDWRYRFPELYVGNYDKVPNDAIQCVPGSQTSKGFAVKFSGAPTTADSVLFWEVRIPDNLQMCQSLTSEPKYAIVPPYQKGVEPIVVNQDFVEVLFPEEHPTADWYPEFIIENLAADIPQVFAWTLVERGAFGFKISLQGAPTESGYNLRWRIS